MALEDLLSTTFLVKSRPLKGVRAERAAREDRERTIKKKWVIAQLKHYGIKVDAKANEYEVQALLVKSVSEGHVSTNYRGNRALIVD